MRRTTVFAVLLLCAGTGAAFADPSALVKLATARQGALSPQLTAYGTVGADTNYLITIPMPRDARVLSVSVRPGEAVKKGDPLMTIETAPGAAVAFGQAKSALSFAATDLSHTRRLYDEQLATRSQLAAAEKAYADAQTALAQQQRMGADRPIDALRSPVAGVAVTIAGSPGDAVNAGTVVATIANRDRLTANFGLEPADAPNVHVGALATLRSRQNDSLIIRAPVISVSAMIDPQSRLVNAVVRIPQDVAPRLLVGMTLTGRIDLEPHGGIVVPRTALLSDSDGTYVFVVTKGVAERRGVTVSLETDRDALVARGLKPGDQVAIDGVAGLDSGMHVRTR
jgi:RND family efflux transporter MFP subunit